MALKVSYRGDSNRSSQLTCPWAIISFKEESISWNPTEKLLLTHSVLESDASSSRQPHSNHNTLLMVLLWLCQTKLINLSRQHVRSKC